jgi:hypothetical protein
LDPHLAFKLLARYQEHIANKRVALLKLRSC